MKETPALQHELAFLVESEIPLPLVGVAPEPDSDIAKRMALVRADLIRRAGGEALLAKRTGDIIRAAVDYVIDAPTLFRYSIDDLEPDEKTAIGKRIERLFRFHFDIPKGEKLDIRLAGEEVDIKTTMGRNWMFSKSSHGHVNLLFAYSEAKALFRVGLAYVLEDHLNAKNRDEKQSLSSEHRENIMWILKDEPYAPNFLMSLQRDVLKEVISQPSGNRRVAHLLRSVLGVAIPRHAICSVANQQDPLKRIRSNGGARDILWREDIMVLSGRTANERRIAENGLGITLLKDEILAVKSNNPGINDDLVKLFSDGHFPE